jgi:UDP-N-acetyl-D-glucosamine dehydrogenase
MGLPLAVEFARTGFRVTGIDADARRVASVSRGESHLADVPAADVARLVGAGRLAAETAWDVVTALDAIAICVPTPFTPNREPDLSFVRAAGEEIAGRLRPGQLIVLESTTYPGTTEDVLRPILEARGLVAGRDFALAYSPERVDPGNRDYHVTNTPRLVGGVTPGCTALAVALYEKVVIKVVPVSSPRVAETAKLLENIFRNVNIALVNELAMLCDRMRIDVWEVVGGGHQAVRLHELPAGPRGGGALHPGRSRLPGLEGQGVRLLHELHHAGGGSERQHAVLRGGEAAAPARATGRPRAGEPGARPRGNLQA